MAVRTCPCAIPAADTLILIDKHYPIFFSFCDCPRPGKPPYRQAFLNAYRASLQNIPLNRRAFLFRVFKLANLNFHYTVVINAYGCIVLSLTCHTTCMTSTQYSRSTHKVYCFGPELQSLLLKPRPVQCSNSGMMSLLSLYPFNPERRSIILCAATYRVNKYDVFQYRVSHI